MAKYIDLTNKQFSYLTVLEKTDKRGSDRSIIWKCKCKCGKIVEVNGSNLRSGHTKSCGCIKKDHPNRVYKGKDISNQSFGLLTALEPTKERKRNGSIVWKCRCRCGNIKYASEHALTQKLVQSCGCLSSKGERKITDLLQEHNIIFEREKKFSNCVSSLTNSQYRFDFWVNNAYIIEFDGGQHFFYKEGSGWNTKEHLQKTQFSDKEKNKWCKENNIPIIRIPYTHYDNLCIEDLLLETSNFII